VDRLTSYLRRHHLAVIALFVALGGTSYAAVQLPKGSVGSRQIRANAVTSKKVKNGSLTAKDLKAGQLVAGPRGVAGADGAPCLSSDPDCRGPRGETGAQGPGAMQLSYSTQVNVTDEKLATVGPWEIWAQCDHQGGTNFLLRVLGPGFADYEVMKQVVDDNTGPANPVFKSGRLALSTNPLTYVPDFQVTGFPTSYQHFVGTLELRSGTTAAHVQLHGAGDGRTNPGPGTCSAYGVAIPAT
jgi:hypothetical protein